MMLFNFSSSLCLQSARMMMGMCQHTGVSSFLFINCDWIFDNIFTNIWTYLQNLFFFISRFHMGVSQTDSWPVNESSETGWEILHTGRPLRPPPLLSRRVNIYLFECMFLKFTYVRRATIYLSYTCSKSVILRCYNIILILLALAVVWNVASRWRHRPQFLLPSPIF